MLDRLDTIRVYQIISNETDGVRLECVNEEGLVSDLPSLSNVSPDGGRRK